MQVIGIIRNTVVEKVMYFEKVMNSSVSTSVGHLQHTTAKLIQFKKNENNKNIYDVSSQYKTDNNDDRFAMKQLAIEELQKYSKDKYRRLMPPPLVGAKCRYQGRFQGGSWDRKKSRLVCSNRYYNQGKFPNEILFSCDAHSNEDLVDDTFHLCYLCDKIFRLKSMFDDLSCKVCHDAAILQEKTNWIQPTKKLISKEFNFSHVCGNTLIVADRRNLPKTLKSFGNVRASLNYNVIFKPREVKMRDENQNDGDNDDFTDSNNTNNHLNAMILSHSNLNVKAYNDGRHFTSTRKTTTTITKTTKISCTNKQS